MKYWKEKEINPVEKMEFWKGDYITKLEPNEVFVFGANPQARHFAGAAKAALGFGAVPINVKQNKPGIARGLSPNNKTYALITKSLEAGYTEPETGITYHKEGFQSVSPEQIRANVDELYETAKKPEHLDKKFLVTYQYEAWPNGTPKKSLNGYTSQEMLEMFAKDKEVPPNIIFHESYKPHLEKLYKNQNKQPNGELVVYEDGKSVDINEEDIVWTIDADERNPVGWNGAGGAKTAMLLGKGSAKNGIAHGFNGSNTYALLTKILPGQEGVKDPKNGFVYNKTGYQSVSTSQIRDNIKDLYKCALENPEKQFLITYQFETWPNGSPKKSLNGYTSKEMLEMFVVDQDIPDNIVFHDSYKSHIEKILSQTNKVKPMENMPTKDNSSTQNPVDNLIVISPREKAPEDFTVINTTSKDTGHLGKLLSPFYLSNIPLYEGQVAKNMENAWQFAKVYKEFADEDSKPTQAYFEWAKKGWNDSYAHRYANGKENIPLYSYWKTLNTETNVWEEHKYDYVTARKNIYFPLYAKAVVKSAGFKELKDRLTNGEKIALWDFDGYDHAARNMSYEDVVNSSKYKCGHAFVLYGLLTGQLKLINDELVYDFNNEIKMENKEQEPQAKPVEYTYFFQATSPFSQWHPSLFTYKELNFICAEQFMMYAKAKTFKDDAVADKVINIEKNFIEPDGTFKTPQKKECYNLIMDFKNGQLNRTQIVSNYKTLTLWKEVQTLIKALGRQVSNFDETIWNGKRVGVVGVASREKYNQNDDLKNILMKTKNNKMVEASKYDKIWGIGLDEATARKTPVEQWPGLNLLGDVLTDLKTYYLEQETKNNSKMKM